MMQFHKKSMSKRFMAIILVLFLLCKLENKGVLATNDLQIGSTVGQSLLPPRLLNVGKELKGERLLLEGGRCLYKLLGLENSKSYEVKISYPASIPASFTIELYNYGFKGLGRRLLNTEKLMFHADPKLLEKGSDGVSGAFILVSVRAAGVVAKRNAQDHRYVFYNILCEKVYFGIPRQAFWVGLLAVIAVLVSLFVAVRLSALTLVKFPAVKSIKEMR